MVSDEHTLVVERLNGYEVTRATLLQNAVASILSKKGGKLFEKQIARLNIETTAYEVPDNS